MHPSNEQRADLAAWEKKNNDKHHIFASTSGARCTIFPKLCTVIQLVEAIEKICYSFFDPAHSTQGARKNSASLRDARFLSNNSVTCDANHIKFERLIRRIKAPKKFRNRLRLRGDSTKNWRFLIFWAPHSHPCGDWREIFHSEADACARRPYLVRRESPAGRKTWFLPCE